MQFAIDEQADSSYLRIAPEHTAIAETREVAPGVMLDLDATGNLVGIEILSLTPRATGRYGQRPIGRVA